MLEYYMGTNTRDRQEMIINNLRIETDIVDENPALIEKPEGELETAWV